MSAPALRVEHLSAPFGRSPGLRDLSFEVQAGERFVLVGASGAGKTTLLRGIAGLAPAVARRIEVSGREVGALPPERRDVVYLHQAPLLFPHLTVSENIAFPLRVRRVPSPEAEQRVREVLRAVRLEGFGARMPSTLSGGQRHRVALARAIVARPSALLLDEPFASLDPSLRQEVGEAVRAVQREYGPALIVVTHDLDEAGTLGHRIGVLLDRELAQVATPAELFARPATLAVARFLGLPNEIQGRVGAEGCFHSVLGTLPTSERGAGAVVALFRPQAVRMVEQGGVAGRLVEYRHRVQQTTAIVDVDGTRVEVAVDGVPGGEPGAAVRLSAHPDRIALFPAP